MIITVEGFYPHVINCGLLQLSSTMSHSDNNGAYLCATDHSLQLNISYAPIHDIAYLFLPPKEPTINNIIDMPSFSYGTTFVSSHNITVEIDTNVLPSFFHFKQTKMRRYNNRNKYL